MLFDGWWTLFIIVPCAIGLITDRDKTGSIIGYMRRRYSAAVATGRYRHSHDMEAACTCNCYNNRNKNTYHFDFFSKKFADIPIAAANVKNGSGTAIFSGSDLNYSGKVFGGNYAHSGIRRRQV